MLRTFLKTVAIRAKISGELLSKYAKVDSSRRRKIEHIVLVLCMNSNWYVRGNCRFPPLQMHAGSLGFPFAGAINAP